MSHHVTSCHTMSHRVRSDITLRHFTREEEWRGGEKGKNEGYNYLRQHWHRDVEELMQLVLSHRHFKENEASSIFGSNRFYYGDHCGGFIEFIVLIHKNKYMSLEIYHKQYVNISNKSIVVIVVVAAQEKKGKGSGRRKRRTSTHTSMTRLRHSQAN